MDYLEFLGPYIEYIRENLILAALYALLIAGITAYVTGFFKNLSNRHFTGFEKLIEGGVDIADEPTGQLIKNRTGEEEGFVAQIGF